MATTLAEVLRHYGYKTSAFGKWHNTPANQTTAMGPFDRWPTGHGFDYFYGFLAGETSQWEPRLVENTNVIEPPHDPKYHLSEDLAQRSVDWLRRHRAFAPNKPFLLYWAPGAGHGPDQSSPQPLSYQSISPICPKCWPVSTTQKSSRPNNANYCVIAFNTMP